MLATPAKQVDERRLREGTNQVVLVNVKSDRSHTAGGTRGAGVRPRPGGRDRRHRYRRDGSRAARRYRGGTRYGARRPDRGHRYRRGRRVCIPRTPPGHVRRDVDVAGLPARRAAQRGARCGSNHRPGHRPVGTARRAGRRRRQPRAAAIGDRVPGSHRRHPIPRRDEPGRHHARLPVAEPGAVVQRRHPPDQRRGLAGAAGQPAQPRPRPYAGAGERRAATVRRSWSGSAVSPTARRGPTSRPFRRSRCGRWRCCATAPRRSTGPTPSPAC